MGVELEAKEPTVTREEYRLHDPNPKSAAMNNGSMPTPNGMSCPTHANARATSLTDSYILSLSDPGPLTIIEGLKK